MALYILLKKRDILYLKVSSLMKGYWKSWVGGLVSIKGSFKGTFGVKGSGFRVQGFRV